MSKKGGDKSRSGAESSVHTVDKCWSKDKPDTTDKKSTARNDRVNHVTVTAVDDRRIYRKIAINGVDLTVQLDTGSDISMISNEGWTALGRPDLQYPTIAPRCTDASILPI